MIKLKYFVVTMIIFMVTKQTPLNCTFVLTVVLKMTPTKVVIQKYCFLILSIYFYFVFLLRLCSFKKYFWLLIMTTIRLKLGSSNCRVYHNNKTAML